MNASRNIAGYFEDLAKAEQTADAIRQRAQFRDKDVRLFEASDENVAGALAEPSRKVRRSIVYWHVVLWLAGLVLGAIAGLYLPLTGPALFADSPGFTLLVCVLFGMIAGLLMGGFIASRPLKSHATVSAADTARGENWAVVVRCRSNTQYETAMHELQTAANKVTPTTPTH